MHVMGQRGKRAGTAVLLVTSLALGLAACGGKDSSKKHASSADVGSTAAIGTTGSAGATGATGAAGASGTTGAKRSGGSKPPSAPTAHSPTPAPSAPARNTGKPSRKQPSKNAPNVGYNPGTPTAGELAGLYSEAKQVCKALTLQGLAREYQVAPTPKAVAKAYADAYSKAVKSKKRHDAIYRGCKDGLS
jgi:hypothetical protein